MQLSQLHRFRHVRQSKKTCASPSSFELELLLLWRIHIPHTVLLHLLCWFFCKGCWNTCFPFAPRGRLFCALFLAKLKCTLRIRVAPAELLRASGSIRRCRPLAHSPQKRNQRTERRCELTTREKTGNVSACSCRDCECR